MPDDTKESGRGFEGVMRDLEDSIFGLEEDKTTNTKVHKTDSAENGESVDTLKRQQTLPTLIDRETAGKILKDFMKEKNQRKYEIIGLELLFKPYWFFTYSSELVMRDNNKNITDAQEIGGRVAVDAVNGNLTDYLQDLLDHEPIEIVDLADELAQIGGDAKVIEPKISEDRLERFVQQKISGVLKAEKENVSVAGFEMLWSPVYRFWLTMKKRTHNVQIDGCGGYPVNYDDMPLRAKTWVDVIQDDISLLKDPKKWSEVLKKKSEAARKSITSGSVGKPSAPKIELLVTGVLGVGFLYGLLQKDLKIMVLCGVFVAIVFWYMNYNRKKPLLQLPPPPFMGEGGQ